MRDDARPSDSGQHGSSATDLLSLWRKAAGAGWLRACYDVLRRTVEDDRTQYGTSVGASYELARNLGEVLQWATHVGIVLSSDAIEPFVAGGREHDLIRTRAILNRVIKITIGPNFGFYPCCFPKQQFRDVANWFSTREGTLKEYCERLLLLNALFPRCDTQLLGFVNRPQKLHAITAQWIAQGRPAQNAEIRAWLLSEGFVFIAAWTWFRPSDGVALFDVMEKNVMLCTDGVIVPFDVIPIQCDGQMLEMMEAAVARLNG